MEQRNDFSPVRLSLETRIILVPVKISASPTLAVIDPKLSEQAFETACLGTRNKYTPRGDAVYSVTKRYEVV